MVGIAAFFETAMKQGVRWFLLGVIALVLTTCASMKTTTRADLTPFADNMIAIAGDIQYGLGQQEVVFLRDYMHGENVDQLGLYGDKIRAIIRGAIAYSVEIVTLDQSNMTEPEKAQALASYLDGLLRPVLQRPVPILHISEAQLDTIIHKVGIQEVFLDALQEAQPIINEVARASGEIMDDTHEVLDRVSQEVREQIAADNYLLLTGLKKMRDMQLQTLLNVEYIRMYRDGEASAMDSLLKKEPSLKEIVSSSKKPTSRDLKAIEERLIFKMRALSDVREQLAPDMEFYWNQQRELDTLTKAYNAALRKANVAIIAFSRAHQRLANGVTDPAKINLLGLARSVTGSMSPF